MSAINIFFLGEMRKIEIHYDWKPSVIWSDDFEVIISHMCVKVMRICQRMTNAIMILCKCARKSKCVHFRVFEDNFRLVRRIQWPNETNSGMLWIMDKTFSRGHFEIFFLLFLENIVRHFMHNVLLRDNLQEMSSIFLTKYRKISLYMGWTSMLFEL